MTQGASTVDVAYFQPGQASEAIPGLLVVFQGQAPHLDVHALVDGEIEVGRAAPGGVTVDDRTMSRRHARVSLVEGRFEVEDLGSRNGFVIDGTPIASGESGSGTRVLRLGETVIVFCPDIRPLRQSRVEVKGGVVVGPTLRQAWDSIDSIAEKSEVLHLRGESGVGKELAAARFHESHRRGKSDFVPVNCAAIPQGVAERLLFGAKKGAFSGAHADAEGLVQAANKGTLFLDEIGELDLDVQAKLLRVLESKTVMPVGEVKAQEVEFRLVSATHKDLREQVSDRSFREDLFYRLGRPEVILPPLRERPEEIPYICAAAIGPQSLPLSPAFIEACLLRPWPGNVREIVLEAKEAARRATQAKAAAVDAEYLSEGAGLAYSKEPDAGSEEDASRIDKSKLPEREKIEEALRESGGKVATAARNLGVHRNQLRRWLSDNEVDPTSFA